MAAAWVLAFQGVFNLVGPLLLGVFLRPSQAVGLVFSPWVTAIWSGVMIMLLGVAMLVVAWKLAAGRVWARIVAIGWAITHLVQYLTSLPWRGIHYGTMELVDIAILALLWKGTLTEREPRIGGPGFPGKGRAPDGPGAPARTAPPVVSCLLALAALLLLASFWALPADAQEVRIPHPPIRIGSDEGFLLPGSGVVGGLGTAESPYVISGWDIDLGAPWPLTFGMEGIGIHGTTKHFVIRDCRIHISLPLGVDVPQTRGIDLSELENGSIEAVEVEGTMMGIGLRGVRDVSVSGAALAGPRKAFPVGSNGYHASQGIHVRQSRGVAVASSSIEGYSDGATVHDSRQVRLADLRVGQMVEPGAGSGILFWGGADAEIEQATVTGARWGLNAHSIRGLQVRHSSFIGGDAATHLSNATGTQFDNVAWQGSEMGVHISQSTGFAIRGSAFLGLGRGLSIGDGQGGVVESSLFEGNGWRSNDAIHIYRQPGLRFEGNTVQGNKRTAFMVYDHSPGLLFRNNTVANNTGSGLSVESDDAVVTRNRIANNGGYGIEVWQMRGGFVEDNEVRDNAKGDVQFQRFVQHDNTVRNNDAIPGQTPPAARQVPGIGMAVLLGLALAASFRARRQSMRGHSMTESRALRILPLLASADSCGVESTTDPGMLKREDWARASTKRGGTGRGLILPA